MTQGNVIGEEFEQYVFNQIDVRQSIQGSGGLNSPLERDPKILNYINNRNAWVKMASGVSLINQVDGEDLPELLKGISRLKNISKDLGDSSSSINYEKYNGQGLAKNFVLFNTLSNLNFKDETSQDFSNYSFRSGIQKSQQAWLDVDSSYGFGGTSMGLQPTPGIIDVSIDCINRGSIRKATVTLKAFNTYQFSVIEMLYLRLGYTMMLEWGWDRYLYKTETGYEIRPMETTLIEKTWFKNQTETSQIGVVKEIEEIRETYQGNYDGFFGKVNNFTWNFNPDGSYDITINLITVGDVVESLKVNTSVDMMGRGEKIKYQKDIKEKQFTEESINYKSAGNDKISRHLNNLILQHSGENDLNNPIISYNSIEGVNGEEYGKYGEPIPTQELNYFVRLGWFLEYLESNIIPKSSTNENVISIETDPDNNYIKTYLNQIPFNPKVCLFTMEWGENFLDSYSDFKNKKPFFEINEGLPQKFIVKSKDGYTAGKLMNIYLNVNFLLKILNDRVDEKGDLSLYKLVESICKGLNNSLGGFNNLEPVIKEDKTLIIIDQNPIPGLSTIIKQQKLPKKDIPKIEVFGYNNGKSNFLKDIKFQTKIDNSLASMISIGATADGQSTKNSDATSFSKWNIGLKDRFKPQYKDPKDILSPEDKTAMGTILSEYKKNAEIYARNNITSSGGKWKIPYSSTYPTTSKNWIIKYKYPNFNSEDDIIKFFINDTVKAIKIRDAKTYEENETKRLTENTYAGYLHDIFGVNFPYGDDRTDLNIKAKYNKLFSKDTLVNRGKTTFKSFIDVLSQSEYKETQSPSGNIGFIPVSFDLTLEGLSGVKIYNKLNIDTRFLPPNYGNSLDFLITKVNHKISGNNWDTVLGTISTSNIEDAKPSNPTLAPSGDFKTVKATSFSRRRNGATRSILGDDYTNGEVPDNNLRTINNESKYKGSIQSDKGRIRLFTEASLALDKLLEKAEQDKIQFKINSAYRTYDDQVRVREAYPKTSAVPGTSNHGFGLAVDFATLSYAKLTPQDPQYKWLVKNADDFGFRRINPETRREPESWEAWHWEFQISEYTNKFTEVFSEIANYYFGDDD